MLAATAGTTPWTLVGGKGGVGKTTIASALAIALADAGEHVLILSVDPAHSLGDALDTVLGPEPLPVPGVPNLRAMELDAERERTRWLERHRAALAELLNAGTYLEREEIEGLLDLAVPGADELASMLHLSDLPETPEFGKLVIDTAPTGHALRLLETPGLAREWLAALAALDARRRAVVEALTRHQVAPGDPVRSFLDELEADIRRLSARLGDPSRTRCLLVTTPEPMVSAETRRYYEALERAGISVGAVVVNRASGNAGPAVDQLGRIPAPLIALPLLRSEPRGADALRQLGSAAWGADESVDLEAAVPARSSATDLPARPRHAEELPAGERWSPPAGRTLYVVAGKGGVGKTTVASAMAAILARECGQRTLLLGVDPAGSLGDAWGVEVRDEHAPVPGEPRLHLRQLDAATVWEEFRSSYQAGLAGVLADVVGEGGGVLSDRFAELVPPGLDELVALAELARLVDDAAYDAIVVDTPPTGHLLRLLEAPGVARQWAHAILRIMLRYREVASLGEPGERVLRFAREVRRLEELLRDRRQTFVAVIALPEALSVAETRRLLQRVRERGVHPEVLIVNQLSGEGATVDAEQGARALELLSLAERPEAVAAPALAQGPRGLDELLSFARSWRSMDDPVREFAA